MKSTKKYMKNLQQDIMLLPQDDSQDKKDIQEKSAELVS
jgi:hypothetical protein